MYLLIIQKMFDIIKQNIKFYKKSENYLFKYVFIEILKIIIRIININLNLYINK